METFLIEAFKAIGPIGVFFLLIHPEVQRRIFKTNSEENIGLMREMKEILKSINESNTQYREWLSGKISSVDSKLEAIEKTQIYEAGLRYNRRT